MQNPAFSAENSKVSVEFGTAMPQMASVFRTYELRNPEDFQVEKRLPKAVLEASTTEESISEVALLTQMGCLTLKRSEAGDFYVGCPNEEVTFVSIGKC